MKRLGQRSIRLGLLVLGTFTFGIVALEIFLRVQKPLEFPFHNVLYPYVEFRPPSNALWRSSEPSPSSRSREYAVEYTNQDSLRIESPDYKLDRTKPKGQIRIGMLGGSTVRIGTTFDVTLPGALKKNLRERYPSADIEVINGGIISAISRQELVFLITTLLDYDLDILITYDGINDSGQMLHYERRPNFPYNYRVIEEAWLEYVTGRKGPLWQEIIGRSAIMRSLWPGRYGPANILDRVAATELVESSTLRVEYAKAHIDNWEKIRRICLAYGIRPLFALQPTSLYAVFPNGSREKVAWTPTHDNLYANYLVYEEFRKSISKFSSEHPEIAVLDLSSFLPFEAFFDGAHVYDDVNDTIARQLADSIAEAIDALQQPRKTINGKQRMRPK